MNWQEKIFAVVRDGNGRESSALYQSWRDFHAAMFAPETDVIAVHRLTIYGRTYRQRKNSLRNLAINIQAADNGGLSYGEIAELQGFFAEHGRKLGLLREFRENAVC